MLAILTTHPIQYQVPIWQALERDGRVPFEVWYLTRHGVERSHDVEFGEEFTWDIDTLTGYPHRFLETSPDATPTTFWKCRVPKDFEKQLRASGVKALWVQGWQVSAYWQAVWEARRAGVEVWLRGESNDLAPTPLWKRGLKRIVLGQLFQRVDKFLHIGTANKRFYRKFCVPEVRLHSAPYAVDDERFARQAEAVRGERSVVRRQWGIPDDAFCVLFCGKFIPKKRPLDLVEAAKVLLYSNPQVSASQHVSVSDLSSGSALHSPLSTLPKIHLLFVGSGELGPQLRSACHVVFDAENPNSLLSTLYSQPVARPPTSLSTLHSPLSGTKPPASFAGFLNQTEISKAYVAADCLVLPSDYGETWGLVVNEAMASGLPCVISNRCGCVEDLGVIPPNQIFNCSDITVLAKRLAFLAQPAERSRVALEALAVFSFARTVQIVAGEYQRSVATNRHR